MTTSVREKIKDVFLLDKGNLLISEVDLLGVKTSGSKKALIKEDIALITEDVIRENDTFLFFEIQPVANLGSFWHATHSSRVKVILLGGQKFYNVEVTPNNFVKYFSVIKQANKPKPKYNTNTLSKEEIEMLNKIK